MSHLKQISIIQSFGYDNVSYTVDVLPVRNHVIRNRDIQCGIHIDQLTEDVMENVRVGFHESILKIRIHALLKYWMVTGIIFM